MAIERGAQDGVALSWRIKERPHETAVEFYGEIDENSDFAELRRRLSGAIVFELAKVRRVNSCGVREWVNFLRDLKRVHSLTFTHCSLAIVTQLNMIDNFRGPAVIGSFLAPYVCESCHAETERLLDVAKDFPARAIHQVPAFACDTCGAMMVFDDVPERYLSFLREA